MNINNINFTSFIHVAEAGSFNKAADGLYITSTALIKQINLLENDLGVTLFERSHRGLKLTKAGESLYKDAKYITEYCREAVLRAKDAMSKQEQVIRIGTSPIMPAQMLMDLWTKIREHCADVSFRLVPFENTSDNARGILENLGQNIDVVTGFVDELLMSQRNCVGFEIEKEPFCCAMSMYHPLAQKEKLTVEDLYGKNLMMIHPGWCQHMDELRRNLTENHPQIHLVDFELYDVGIFNRCEQNNDILVSIKSWEMVHPLMKVIPVEWDDDYTMPVGILYSPQPTEVVKRFLSALKEVLGSSGRS